MQYFISDLHLHAANPQNTKVLLDFLQDKGQHADAIYILGDLFALWLGDDIELPKYQDVTKAIQQITLRNIPVYYMHGNRDFLIGKRFVKQTGCTMLPDPYVIQVYNTQVLLTHGDLLCTYDSRYQSFRKFVQNPIIKSLFILIPKKLRIKLGLWVKSKAHNDTTRLDAAIYDVNEALVYKWLQKHSARLMIHGHTHKPQIINNRVVLGDWTDKSAQILEYSKQGFALVDLIPTPNTDPA